jgi:hypothetical protein
MPDTPDTVEMEWTYVGRREVAGGGLAHTWLDDTGAERLFKSGYAGVVGGVYRVHATPERNSMVTKGANGPTFLRTAHDDPRISGWQADDDVAYAADQLRRSEQAAKRAGADRFGELTINDVRRRMLDSTGPQRAALVARVLRQIGV